MLFYVDAIQMLRSIICHPKSSISQCDGSTSSSHGSTTCSKKGIVQNNHFHNSTNMNKHLVHEHTIKLKFIEAWVMYIAKAYETMSSVQSPWLHRLVMCRDNKIQVPNQPGN
jgi:hypothetical protein